MTMVGRVKIGGVVTVGAGITPGPFRPAMCWKNLLRRVTPPVSGVYPF